MAVTLNHSKLEKQVTSIIKSANSAAMSDQVGNGRRYGENEVLR